MDDRVPVEREAVVEVVALISSAGGLDALTVVLRDLPVDLPAAVVVQHHLGGQGSALLQILQRRVDLPMAWANDQARHVPGQVMVCPPQKR
jgi:two-component system chemotaxis response regulator CheB